MALTKEKAPETEANPIPIAYRLRGFVKRANWRNQMIYGSIVTSSKLDNSFNLMSQNTHVAGV
jgi:hypothetical protein